MPDPSPSLTLDLRGEGGAELGREEGGGGGEISNGEERGRIVEAKRALGPVCPPLSDLAERPNFALAIEVSVFRHYVK